METMTLLRLWGKTHKTDATQYHPLLFHLFDVAHCAQELWKRLPTAVRERLSRAVGLDEIAAGNLYALLAGLHDLGKAYPGFQNKAVQFVAALEAVGFDFPDCIGSPPHNFVSVPEVERLFREARLFPEPLHRDVSEALAYALGAHHGVFPRHHDMQDIDARTLGLNPQWQAARNALADRLIESLEGARDSAPPVTLTDVSDRAFVPLLAAFITLADWFGSSRYFPILGPQNIEAYRADSRRHAEEALTKSGWTPPVEANEERTFTELFGYLRPDAAVAPNELQTRVAELLQSVERPALWIIEQEMGAGKTEAAFSIFDACRVKGLAHGVYIAMPTQATSNAMYDRLGDFLAKGRQEKEINLILAHSHALLDPKYRERMARAEAFDTPVYDTDSSGEAEDGALRVRSWFTARKQTLLAQYGVGTIDQTLIGVLQTRHWFVRLYGLAGKVVIFDEVHAYDTYMNTLLARLIAWLAELDCTVVLLSATLPKKTRLRLANAYQQGADAQLRAQENPPCYPRITLIQKGQPGEKGTARACIPRRRGGEPANEATDSYSGRKQKGSSSISEQTSRSGKTRSLAPTPLNLEKQQSKYQWRAAPAPDG